MGGDQKQPLLFQPLDQCNQLMYAVIIDRVKRFVQDDHVRIAEKQAGQGRLLFLTAGAGRKALLQKIDGQGVHDPCRICISGAEVLLSEDPAEKLQIGQHGLILHQRIIIRQIGDVKIISDDLSFIRKQATDQIEQCGLSGAVSAVQHDAAFIAAQLQVQILDQRFLCIRKTNMVQFQYFHYFLL